MMSSVGHYTLRSKKRLCNTSVPSDIRQTASKSRCPRLVAMSTPTSKGKGPVSGPTRVKKRKSEPTISEEEVNRFDHTVNSTGFDLSEGVTSAVTMKSVPSVLSSNLLGNIEISRGAMPAFQARALQTLHAHLVDELDFQIVKGHLYSNDLIDHHLMVELSGMTRRQGTGAFLENLRQSGTNGYQTFLKVLQDTKYFDLKLKIEETLSTQFPTNINIVLIGKTGVGKSHLGNSLLNQPAAFVSKPSMNSVTKGCSLLSCKKFHNGKEVTVNIIDSPGLADSSKSTNDIIREIKKCMDIANGRVDVFIVVINAMERMTEEVKAPIHMLKDRYGDKSESFVLIVFTHTDQIPDETNLEDLLKENTFLRETISLFKNRYCSFGIKSVDHDVKEIFNRIFTMIEENYDTYYSHELFGEAGKNFDEQIAAEKKRLKEEKKREVGELTKEIENKLTKKIEDRVRMEFEERYRKTPVDIKASASLGMPDTNILKPVLTIDDQKNKKEKSFRRRSLVEPRLETSYYHSSDSKVRKTDATQDSGSIETMPAFQASALQTLHVQLVRELDIQYLIDYSFSNGFIDHHLMKELSGMTRREGIRAFLENLQQSGTNGYPKFLEVLQATGYVDLKRLKIEETLSKQFPKNINIVLENLE